MFYITPILFESSSKIRFCIKSASSDLTCCFWFSSVASGSFGFRFFKALICSFAWSSVVIVYFSKVFPKGEQVNLVCFVICSWVEGNKIFMFFNFSLC